MIEGYSYRSEAAKAVSFSGSEFWFVVEAFNDAVGKGAFGSK